MRSLSRLALLAAVFPAAAGAQSPLPLKHAPRPTKPEITAADLMTRLYIFSDDSMQGREAGTPGNVKGTNYIAAEAKRMGLIPAGDNGTYFQTIPYKQRSFDSTSSLTVNGTPLTMITDFLPTDGTSTKLNSVAIVYGGDLSDTLHQIAADQAGGKLVVFTVAGGVGRRLRRAPSARSAAAIAIVGLETVAPQTIGRLRQPRGFLDDRPAGATPPTPMFLVTSATADKMFATPIAQLAPGATGGTATIDLKVLIEPMASPARNVVGIVRGSDPKLSGEYVAIGGHNDHLGIGRIPFSHDSIMIWNHVVRPEGADDGGKQATPAQQATVDSLLADFRKKHPGADRTDSIYNGADDDGSGSVSVLEIAERVASLKVKPKRSLLFVWHVGEEKGLLGSRFFTDHPTVPRDSIVAQLNMDMIGRGDAGDETGRTKEGTPLHGSPTYLQLVGSRRLSTELGDMVEQVNTADHHNLTLDYALDADGHPSNIYCRSDHYEYARYGIPIVFFTTGLHSDYHQVTDEPEYIDYTHMAKVVNLVEDIAVHVANLDHRVVVDKPKPDPNGACRQ